MVDRRGQEKDQKKKPGQKCPGLLSNTDKTNALNQAQIYPQVRGFHPP